jgi:hypothetical protein
MKASQQILKVFTALVLIIGSISLNSCELIRRISNRGPDTLDTIVVKEQPKDSQKVVKTPVDPPKVEKIDTIIWLDTLQMTEFKRVVVQYTQIGKNPVLADTISKIDLSSVVEVPKNELQKRDVRKKEVYNVAIIMPFLTDRYDFKTEIPARSLRAVEFYEGVKIALDSLEAEDLKLRVKVYDSKRSNSAVENILKKTELEEADLIIGPISTGPMKLVADFAKTHQIPVVSPFNYNTNIPEDNHFYMQLTPSYEVHSRYIAYFLKNKIEIPKNLKFPLSKVSYLIVGSESDTSRVKAIQEAYKVEMNDAEVVLDQYIEKEKDISIESIKKYFSKEALNVVIVPSYRSESFVSGILRELHSMVDRVESENSFQFLVIGMPQWKYYERMNFEYYENLRLHLTDPYFVDDDNSRVQKFKKGYKQLYGIAPREFAFMGYDLMLYLGHQLKKYGTGFPDYFHKEIETALHTRFYFDAIMRHRKIMKGEDIVDDALINHYENQYIHLLQFDDYEFKVINTGFIQEK